MQINKREEEDGLQLKDKKKSERKLQNYREIEGFKDNVFEDKNESKSNHNITVVSEVLIDC